MLEDFVDRFEAAVDVLKSHPTVRVTHVSIGAPASDEELSRWESARGCPLPAALASLYRRANGLQLRWMDTADQTYDPERDDETSVDRVASGLYDRRGNAAGLLDLPSIEVLAGRDTVGSQFGSDDEDLSRAIVFDSFSEYSEAVLYFGDGREDPWVSIASDHLADVPPPGELTLSQYLDQVLATWASLRHRGKGGARRLADVLRQRIAIDETRLIGERVIYVDEGRGHSIMHARAISLHETRQSPSWWPFARTLVEVRDDLGETIYIPLRALYRPGEGDAYERLHADRASFRRILEGAARPMFEQLAPVAEHGDGIGVSGGPALAQGAWPFAALCASEPAEQQVHRLVVAIETLLRDTGVYVERPVAWPPNLPRRPRKTTSFMATLAEMLLDVVAILVGGNSESVSAWLGRDTTSRLNGVLALLASRNPSRGYDPRTDPQRAAGFLSSALAGNAPSISLTPQGHLRGTQFGLSDLRVVHARSDD